MDRDVIAGPGLARSSLPVEVNGEELMSKMAASPIRAAGLDLWRCVDCSGPMAASTAGLECSECRREYPIRDGLIVVRDQVTANNQVVRDFYDSPLWPKFRFWEWYTFLWNGGERRSRDKILRHLPSTPGLKLLDVAVGDGVYLDWLPKDWQVVGIDVSTTQLAACRRRLAGRDVPLVLGEAEDLPFADGKFDAVLSIGGFNYFNDPEGALREMARVARPGGTIVVSDEVPDLTDRLPFRRLGLPGVNRWIVSRLMHLGDDFTELVEKYRDLNVRAIGARVLPGSRYELVWMKVGYVLVGEVPG